MEVRRNEKITFRCTRYEKLALAEQAARCSMSTSEYCRSLSLGGRPRERYTEEERQVDGNGGTRRGTGENRRCRSLGRGHPEKAGLDRGGDLFTADLDAGADLLSALRQRGA